MSIELKIKSKHLSEEIKVIKFEERKINNWIGKLQSKESKTDSGSESRKKYRTYINEHIVPLVTIRNHRVNDVQTEVRATFLARAFIDGKPYLTVENKRKDDFHSSWVFETKIVPRVIKMVSKYGNRKQLRDTADLFSNQFDTREKRYEFAAKILVTEWLKK